MLETIAELGEEGKQIGDAFSEFSWAFAQDRKLVSHEQLAVSSKKMGEAMANFAASVLSEPVTNDKFLKLTKVDLTAIPGFEVKDLLALLKYIPQGTQITVGGDPKFGYRGTVDQVCVNVEATLKQMGTILDGYNEKIIANSSFETSLSDWLDERLANSIIVVTAAFGIRKLVVNEFLSYVDALIAA